MTAALERASPSVISNGRRTSVVAFQGERGAYADLAIEAVWGGQARRLACWDFEGVVRAVASGSASYGVLPLRNSIIGDIPGVAEALAQSSLIVQQVVEVAVAHCLLGLPGSTMDGIRTVFSHPAALGQCRRFFSERTLMVPISSYDTAGAAREVAARRRLWEGAIADSSCARRYGLVVLERRVADRDDNTTRFAVFTRAAADGDSPCT